ncbi:MULTISPECIES: hypothetical protein [unclassified Synechococcus]|uniref:hypothetical protein n=1 Tax=unclassified Synechococcus TaxID=2626047 RepID=UPI002AD52F84|nr:MULTISPECIES: hypothetical protein [unclassified Synechococcus]
MIDYKMSPWPCSQRLIDNLDSGLLPHQQGQECLDLLTLGASPWLTTRMERFEISVLPQGETQLSSSAVAFLRTGVMNLLRRGGYRSIRQGIRELGYEIEVMLALGGVATTLSKP